ncbi:bifunctional ABC lipid A transporter [Rhodococcus opacus RKJ300 = JCM 13270]|uniref:Bifunctional ABC lipid A transporter n=1 Tax=Rhodococcus opacus RKJ300 = JCM 13270 TaxID=1165867 RepID=I0WZ79_RHOOP|nr:bifunctional ABC lipid A transporter [Rhodococcus opacus RKJ300 = JCM 13270]
MYNAMHAQEDRRPFSRTTLRRIARFALPHRRSLGWYLLLSVVTAALAVATPVLAGRVVNAIVGGDAVSVVVRLAALIAVIAVLESALALWTRWLSASIGENLILDLRTAVFDHVQRMPIAFFTRTRTGALVSRLNNDVIGAQRAFSDTLSGVVSNLVTLGITLIVMIGISWQITLCALLLLPIFVLPARKMGARLAQLNREAANHNSVMSTQMTERFSAPGATLVKLFGRPSEESAEFAVRARRVRNIGVRTAMLQSVFVTALTLVSALALALVYGLGGFYALRGQLDAGAVVAMAMLLTRLYSPLTALASARMDVMSALVSFERVFEVLDLKPLIAEKPDAVAVPEGPVSVEFDSVEFAYPSADNVAGVARRGRDSRHPRRRRRAAPAVVPRRTRADGRAGGIVRSRQVHHRPTGSPALRRRRRLGETRRGGRARPDRRLRAGHRRHGDSGRAPLPRHRAGQPPARPPGRHAGRTRGGAGTGAAHRPRRRPARRPRHSGRRTRLPAVGRRTPAADHRAPAARASAGGHPRRGNGAPRLHVRGRRPGGAGRSPRRTDRGGDRAPAVNRPRRRSDPRSRGRAHRRTRHPLRTARRGRPVRGAVSHSVRHGHGVVPHPHRGTPVSLRMAERGKPIQFGRFRASYTVSYTALSSS